ncbi:MAG: sugar transferase [Chloroflexota bacterium]
MASQTYPNSQNVVSDEHSANFNCIYQFLRDTPKRAFDFTMALIGLLILAPFSLYIALLIKRDSPGPVFYWGPRMGKNGRAFKMLKFRTMYERPESYDGPMVTAQNDNRITPLGAWLRYTKINELPQLWNVLIGEMSLVGPRPEDVGIVKSWPPDARDEILMVRPGVTSPSSILYHDEEKMLSQTDLMGDYFQNILPDKMRLDHLYVRHHSFFSDLDIIFWTIAILIPRITNSSIPEGYLFAGPFSRLSNRYLKWFILDLGVSLVAIATVEILFRPLVPLNSDLSSDIIMAFGLALPFSIFNASMGLNRILWSKSRPGDAVWLVLSSITSVALIVLLNQFGIQHMLGLPELYISMVVTIGIMAMLGFIAVRYRLSLLIAIASRWLNWRPNDLVSGERVLIIGNGEGSQVSGWLLRRKTLPAPFTIVGMVDDTDPTLQGMLINGTMMLGSLRDLPALVKQHDIGMILSTIPATSPQTDEYIFNLCQTHNIRLIYFNDLLHMVDQQITQPRYKRESTTPSTTLQLERRLEFNALHDSVTQLPNRYLLQDRLKQSLINARRYKIRQAVMFIDLEGLKEINETFGRKFGDGVLKGAAERLVGSKRESDTLARTGDYQFTLILEHFSSDAELSMIAKRIYNRLLQPFGPFGINTHQFTVTTTISLYLDPQNTANPEFGSSSVDITKYYDQSKIIQIEEKDG